MIRLYTGCATRRVTCGAEPEAGNDVQLSLARGEIVTIGTPRTMFANATPHSRAGSTEPTTMARRSSQAGRSHTSCRHGVRAPARTASCTIRLIAL